MDIPKKLAFGIVFFLVGVFLWHSILVLSFPFDTRGGCEGHVLSQSVRLIRGEAYRSPQSPPFQIEVYPPVFPVFAGMFSFLFGETLLAGRLVSLLASLLCLVSLYLLFRMFSVRREIALLFTFALLVSGPVFHWGILCRVDMLALAFSLWGFYFFLKGRRIFSLVLFTLAFYTKPTVALAAPLSCLLGQTENYSRKQALIYLSCLGCSIAGIGGLLFALTQGQFPDQMLLQMYYPVDFRNASIDTFYFVFLHGFFFVIALDQVRRNPRVQVSLYLIFSLCILMATIGKTGSDINYFIEPTAALLLCSGVGFERLSYRGQKRAFFLFSLVFVQLLVVNPVLRPNGHVQLLNLAMPDRTKIARVFEAARSSSGHVLVEDAEHAILAGKTVFLDDAVLGASMAEKGRWDSTPFLVMCKRKDFSLIAYYWRFDLIPGFSKCIQENYVLVDRFDQQRGVGTVALPHITKGIFHMKYQWKIYRPKKNEAKASKNVY